MPHESGPVSTDWPEWAPACTARAPGRRRAPPARPTVPAIFAHTPAAISPAAGAICSASSQGPVLSANRVLVFGARHDPVMVGIHLLERIGLDREMLELRARQLAVVVR